MLLCRRGFLLHRGMGDFRSPMSCLIICLDAVIIPRFPLVDKSFPKKNYFFREAATPSVTLRVPAPFQGDLWGMQRPKTSRAKTAREVFLICLSRQRSDRIYVFPSAYFFISPLSFRSRGSGTPVRYGL